MITTRPGLRRKGFTFLELIIAAGLASMLIVMIVTIAQTSMRLSQAIVEKRGSETEKAAFLDLMQRHFENLPGNAILDLRWEDSGSHYTSTMTFQNTPVTIEWGGQIYAAEAIQFVTELKRDGFLDVVLKFYDEEVLSATGKDFLDVDAAAQVTLLEDVHRFEWQVIDTRFEDPLNDWDVRGRLPLKVNLNAIFQPQGEPILHTFWIVPKENPEQYIGNIIQNVQNGGGQNGDGGQGGGPDGGTDPTDPGNGGPDGGQPDGGGGSQPVDGGTTIDGRAG